MHRRDTHVLSTLCACLCLISAGVSRADTATLWTPTILDVMDLVNCIVGTGPCPQVFDPDSCENGDIIAKIDDRWICDNPADLGLGLEGPPGPIGPHGPAGEQGPPGPSANLPVCPAGDYLVSVGNGNYDCTSPPGSLMAMSSAERDAMVNPPEGLVILNTTTLCLNTYAQDSWLESCFNCNPPSQPGSISGPDTICPDSQGHAFAISGVVGATAYSWTVPGDATIVAGQGSPSIIVDIGSTGGELCVTAEVPCGSSAPRCIALGFPTGSQSFSYASSAQPFVVPECVTAIQAQAWGASGGAGGGGGGYAEATLSVEPGETLFVYTGQAGGSCEYCDGTFNGGGGRKHTGYSGGQGGGASDIRQLDGPWDDAEGLASRLLVAGGGGGTGYNDVYGGDGGGLNGGDSNGLGGTQEAGGAIQAGSWCTQQNPSHVTPGEFGKGGQGQGANAGGGGGGGGWYGGGGGCYAGGGGGSSYVNAPGSSGGLTTSGGHYGNGMVTISW